MDVTAQAGDEAIDFEFLSVEEMMSKAKLDAMQARLDVLSLALAALAREVPAERVAAVQELLLHGVEKRLDGVMLSPQTDAAMAADLGRLMCALGDRALLQPGRVTLPG